MPLKTSYICLECDKNGCYGIFPSRNYFGERGHMKRCLKRYPAEKPKCLRVWTNWKSDDINVYCSKDMGIIGTKEKINRSWKFKPTEECKAIIARMLTCPDRHEARSYSS